MQPQRSPLPPMYTELCGFYPLLDRLADHEAECRQWLAEFERSDDTYRVDYAWLLREGDRLTHRHETHIEGLFSRETWLDSIRAAGFEPRVFERELAPEDRSAGYTLEVFLGRRPIETG